MRDRSPGLVLFVVAVAAGTALLVPAWTSAAVIDCKAPGKRLVEVTSVRNTTCLLAREDIDGFVDAFAPTFGTPGGFGCKIARHAPRDTAWRCVKGSQAYRFDHYGVTKPAVRLKGPSYDKTFVVTKCRHPGGAGLVLTGSSLNKIRLQIGAPKGTGTLSLSGGRKDEGIEARGRVVSVKVGKAGSVAVQGRFISSLTGVFRVTGVCAWS